MKEFFFFFFFSNNFVLDLKIMSKIVNLVSALIQNDVYIYIYIFSTYSSQFIEFKVSI
jgi:hypothetical protein